MSAFYIVISIIIVALIVAYILKYRYTSKIRKIRDNIDFTTNEGKLKIEQLNYKLDRVNGYGIYNRD
jgi:hypothetical protein